MNDLHYKIRKIRELRGYTQEYMAESLKISVRSYGNIESGKTALKLDRLNLICTLLCISLDQLIHLSISGLIQSQQPVRQTVSLEQELAMLKQQIAVLNHELLSLKRNAL